MKKIVLLIFIVVSFLYSCNEIKEVNNATSESSSNNHRWKQDHSSTDSEELLVIQEGDTINKIDKNGMLQGEWERLHPDGSFKCRGLYKDGYKMGYWERKFSNGNWRYQVNMNNGYQHGYCKHYYENGNLKIKGNYKMGKKDGTIIIYNENGSIQSKEIFIDGVQTGISKYYDSNGNLLREGNLINGEREGIWNFYSSDGDLIYCVGHTSDTNLNSLWMVYGSIYAAKHETYQRIKTTISEGIKEIPDVVFSETKELGRVNQVDPLGITNLRIRGMWQIENPRKVFNYLHEPTNKKFELICIIPNEKYESFPESSRDKIEGITEDGFSFENKRIQDPNNPVNLLDCKLIKLCV